MRLYPGAAGEAALRDTLSLGNKAANLVSARAFGMRVTGKLALQRLAYADLKAMGLSAQPAIHVARKVSGTYAALKANTGAGNPGEPGSERRLKNRPGQATFRCTSCSFAEHADVNAVRNIAARGAADWAVSHAAGDAARTRHPGAPVTRKLSPPRPRS